MWESRGTEKIRRKRHAVLNVMYGREETEQKHAKERSYESELKRRAKNTCIIKRGRKLRSDMELETADDGGGDDGGGRIAKQAMR